MHSIDYILNDYRQKFVFYRDIMLHCFRHRLERSTDLNGGKIPKVIHYCWFGSGRYSGTIKQCMKTWNKVLPDYKFILWNEENFSLEQYPFAQQALRDKKWAFVSDVARLHALYYEGGIYIDTDVEMIKPFDKFLDYDFFSGFEGGCYLLSAVMGAKRNNSWIKYLLDWYSGTTYSVKDYYEIANTRIITKLAKIKLGLKMNNKNFKFGNSVYFSNDYFSPSDEEGYAITNNTCCIHHASATWK